MVKSSQGLCCRGISLHLTPIHTHSRAHIFKGCTLTPARPFSSPNYLPPPPNHPPSLPLQFCRSSLGSQGSRQPRVNKVIPGVSQRALPPPPRRPPPPPSPPGGLNSHQQRTEGPPFHTSESCWDIQSVSKTCWTGWPSVSEGEKASGSVQRRPPRHLSESVCVCV